MAYTLQLPPQAQIHATFLVPQLKGFKGVLYAQPHIPNWLQGTDVATMRKPAAILDRKLVKQGMGAKVKYLVQWEGQAEEDASWWDADDIDKRFPGTANLLKGAFAGFNKHSFFFCLFSLHI